MKPLRWIGSSRSDLKAFPRAAQREAGHQLWQVQCDEPPDDYKSMSGVGGGVYEIRIRVAGEYRVLYVAKYAEAIYVLHAFEKRTRKTSRHDIGLARRRLAQVAGER